MDPGSDVGVADVNGAQLRFSVTDRRSGLPVVFIHGVALDRRMWNPLVERLRSDHTCLTYDLRGFGQSSDEGDGPYRSSDDLSELLTHLGLERVHVVGLSRGGRIALDFVGRRQERVASLTLIDAAVPGLPAAKELRETGDRIREALSEGDQDAALQQARDVWLESDLCRPAMQNATAAPLLREITNDYRFRQFTQPETDAVFAVDHIDLGAIDVPTLIMVGELDVPYFHEGARLLNDSIPASRLKVVSKAGHLAAIENPDDCASAIREHVLTWEISNSHGESRSLQLNTRSDPS